MSLLSFTHQQAILTPIPAVYYLLLLVYGESRLAEQSEIPMADRLRCLAGLPYLLVELAPGQPISLYNPSDSRLFNYAKLTNDRQRQIWDVLPRVFKLGTWDDLKKGMISTQVS